MNKISQALHDLSQAGFVLMDGNIDNPLHLTGNQISVTLDTILKIPSDLLPIIFFESIEFGSSGPRDVDIENYIFYAEKEFNVTAEDLVKYQVDNFEIQAVTEKLGEPFALCLHAPYNGVILRCFIVESWHKKLVSLIPKSLRLPRVEVTPEQRV